MKKILVISLVSMLVLTTGLFALTGEEILERAERAASPDTDVEMTLAMTLRSAQGGIETRRLEMYQQGSDHLLVRFLEPADIRGVALLTETVSGDGDLIYLYLPAFRRERRIASHVKTEEFMGTGLTYEDMAELDYSEKYRVSSWSQRDGEYILDLEPRSSASAYDRAVMTVNGEHFLPMRIELFEGETVTKRLTVDEVERHQGYWVTMRTTVDLLDSGRQTVMEIEEIEHDADLSDSTFTVRNLRRFR